MRRDLFRRFARLDRPPRRGTPVATRLFWLVVAVTVPLLILSGLEIWRLHDSRRTVQETALLDQARDMAAFVDREFDRVETAISALAASSSLAQKDFDQFEREMRTVSTQLGGLSIGLAGADGYQILTTHWPVGERKSGVMTGPGARTALAERRIITTNLHTSPLTGELVTALAVPIYLQGKASPAYVMIAVMTAARVASVIENQLLPSDHQVGTLLDQDGVIVAHSVVDDDVDVIGQQIHDPLLKRLPREPQGFIRDGAMIAGKGAVFAFAMAHSSGYTVALGVPRHVFDASLRAGLIRTFAIGALLLGTGVLAAGFLAQRLVGPLRALAKSHSGQPVDTGIREIDDLARQLHRTAKARDRAEAELRQLNGDLEQRIEREVADREAAQIRAAQAERMQALGQLAGGIAHDFNNVLQAVAGSASLIERRPGDAATVNRFVRLIIDAASRGAAITQRMLVFARCGTLEAEAIEPAALLEGLREICTYTLGVGIEIRLELASNLPWLVADKGQLETVLVNLATNARDAMANGGILTLSAEPDVVAAAGNHPAALAPGAYIRLVVSDTGIGMDRTVLALS